MAKQAGDIKIVGTLDDVTFYRMGEDYYVRMKSSLTGKRFWKDEAFAGSRRSCHRFGEGNKISSRVYSSLPPWEKSKALYTQLRSEAIRLLKEGKSPEKTERLLRRWLEEHR